MIRLAIGMGVTSTRLKSATSVIWYGFDLTKTHTEGISYLLFSVALQSQKYKYFLYVWKGELKGVTGDHTPRPVLTSLASFTEEQISVSVEPGC